MGLHSACALQGLFFTSLDFHIPFSLMGEDRAELGQETGGGKRWCSAFLIRISCRCLVLGCFLGQVRSLQTPFLEKGLHADPAVSAHHGCYPCVPDIGAGELLPKPFAQSAENRHC